MSDDFALVCLMIATAERDARKIAQATLLSALEEFDLYSECDPQDLDIDDGWLLVEKSTREDTYWLATHASPAAAASDAGGGEYPQDWTVECLINLATGDRYEPIVAWRHPWFPPEEN